MEPQLFSSPEAPAHLCSSHCVSFNATLSSSLSSSSSSSFTFLSQTYLSGHNKLPLLLCCFWNRNLPALLVLPHGWQKWAKKTLFFDGFISPPWSSAGWRHSPPTPAHTRAVLMLTFTHQCGSRVIITIQCLVCFFFTIWSHLDDERHQAVGVSC